MRRVSFWLLSAVLSMALTSFAWAQPGGHPLEGRWVVTDGDEEVEGLLELTAEGGWMIDGSQAHSVSVDPASSHSEYIFQVEEAHSPLHFVIRQTGEAFAFHERDDDLLRAFRVVDLPAELEGEWIWVEPGSRRASRLLVRDGVGLGIGPQVQVMILYAVSIDGDLGLALLEGGGGIDGMLVRTVRLTDSAFLLATVGDDGDMIVLHRPGAAPEEIFGPLGEVSSLSVCDEAANHIRACLAEVCAERPGDPMCEILGDLDDMPQHECVGAAVEAAAEILYKSCDELFPPM